MTIKTIITEPNEILRQVSKPVIRVGNDERKLMDDMLETMYAANGIGLAAIQIGIPKRVVVIDISKDENKKDPIYFVNPELTWKSKEKATYEEGCLSIPDQFAKIDRPEKCTVKFLDYNGNPKEIKAEGLLATCIQHEIDHLNGVLFIDYLSKLKKDMIIKKLKKVLESDVTIISWFSWIIVYSL